MTSPPPSTRSSFLDAPTGSARRFGPLRWARSVSGTARPRARPSALAPGPDDAGFWTFGIVFPIGRRSFGKRPRHFEVAVGRQAVQGDRSLACSPFGTRWSGPGIKWPSGSCGLVRIILGGAAGPPAAAEGRDSPPWGPGQLGDRRSRIEGKDQGGERIGPVSPSTQWGPAGLTPFTTTRVKAAISEKMSAIRPALAPDRTSPGQGSAASSSRNLTGPAPNGFQMGAGRSAKAVETTRARKRHRGPQRLQPRDEKSEHFR